MSFEAENIGIWDDRVLGKWNDNNCDVKKPYICEAPPSETKRSPNPILCSAEEGGGWKFQNSCLHVVTEMKSWDEAEQYCKDVLDGHLVTIGDMIADTFLTHLLSDIKKNMWIGIKIQDQVQQHWTSGWFVSYDGLNKTHENFVEGTCVLRKGRKHWTVDSCSKKHSFICEKSKDHPPALKPAVEGSYCPKEPYGWRDLHGEFCYFIELEKTLSWYEANVDCLKRGGNLLSLHSQLESDILFQFIKYRTYTATFIGLNTLMSDSRKFAWSDGSPVDYENWSSGEPNSFNEKCVELLPNSMKWNDIGCGEKRYYICSTKKICPNVTETIDCTVCPNVTETIDCTVRPNVTETIDCTEHILYKAIIGVSVIACVQTAVLVGITIYYFKSCNVKGTKKSSAVLPLLPLPSDVDPKYTSQELREKIDDDYD